MSPLSHMWLSEHINYLDGRMLLVTTAFPLHNPSWGVWLAASGPLAGLGFLDASTSKLSPNFQLPELDSTNSSLPEQMAAISQKIISNAFHEWKVLYFDSNLPEVCCQGVIWQYVSIGSVPSHYLDHCWQCTDAYMRHCRLISRLGK